MMMLKMKRRIAKNDYNDVKLINGFSMQFLNYEIHAIKNMFWGFGDTI